MFFTKQDKREALSVGAVITLHARDCEDEAQFRILSEVGRGGFAIMYIAKQLGVGERYVALKELFPCSPENGIAERRSDGKIVIYNPLTETSASNCEDAWNELSWYFAHEMKMTQLAGKMLDGDGSEIQQNNPDVLSVSGPYLSDEDNQYLLISTYLGESLATYIDSGWYSQRERGQVPNRNLREILDVLRKASKKLSALHYNKLYHLDLSTANIYLTHVDSSDQISFDGMQSPNPYIIDYGSAYDRDSGLENSHHRFTVNPFSSPEVRALAGIQKQDCGYWVDESSDTYSIVAMLFYAIFGKYYTIDVRQNEEWKDRIHKMYPSEYNGAFAEDLIDFLEIGLSSDQMARFVDTNELSKALNALQKSYVDNQPLGHISSDELMTYYLLDQHPLYQSKNKNGELEVLCLGSGTFVHRMVLSMLSVGQMSAHKLKIHVVSQDASAYRERLKASAPALDCYADFGDGHVGCHSEQETYVDFTFEDVADLLDPDCCEAIAEKYADCRYVVISLGKNSLNTELAEIYAKALGDVNHPVKIHYNTRADVARNQSATIAKDQISPKIKLIEFPLSKKDYFKYVNKLAQRAFKVHYLYARLSNPKASKKEARMGFMGDAYSQCSSTAAAVHLKYKLANVGVTPMATYSERKRAISRYIKEMEENVGELIALEHRRWLMYMISLGYRNPTDDQIRDYCFTTYKDPDSNKVKLNGFKCPSQHLHHCLVPCDTGGLVLNQLSRSDWDKDEMPEGLDELDQRSLTVHRMARDKVLEKRPLIMASIAAMEQYLPDKATTEEGLALYKTYQEFQSWMDGVLSQLVVDQVNEKLAAYEQVLAPVSASIAQEFGKIRIDLAPYVEFAAYKDYKLADLELIENLLWIYYGSDDIDLIKLTGGREVDQVASALIIEPKTVCYIGDSFNDNIEIFFAGHGGNSEVSKIYCPSDDYTKIVETISDRVGEHSVIDITGASDLYIAAATEVSIRLGTPIIYCDSFIQKIINVRNFEIAPIYRLKNKITAEEAYLLFGVRRSEELQIGSDYIHRINDRVDKLYQIYRSCKGDDSDAENADEASASIGLDWDALVTYFMKVSKGSSEFRFKILLDSVPNKSTHCVLDRVSKSFYENIIVSADPTQSGADLFFEKLQSWGIISNFCKQSRTERHFSIQFDCCIEELAKSLKTFWNNGKWSDDSVQLNDYSKFNAKTKELLIDFTSGLYVKTNSQFFEKFALKEKAAKIALKALHDAGFLTMYDTNDGVAFTYLTQADKECLMKAGNFLEALVWKKASDTGKFDDVAPNWCFDWNDGTSTRNELDVILTRGLSTIVVSCKSGNAKKEDLYEVKYLADRFSVNTKAVIVYSKERMYEDGYVRDGIQAIRDRAKAMGIYLIDSAILDSDRLGQTLVEIAEGKSQLV